MKVLIGNKDVIDSLEHALEEARAGRLIGVVICGIGTDAETGETGMGWDAAVREDAPFPYPRILASVATAYQDLLREGFQTDD